MQSSLFLARLRPTVFRGAVASVLAATVAGSAAFAPSALAAIGDTATWNFNLPSTAVASQTPPYPSVATLLLLETVDGVQFTLTPAWNDPPSGRFGTNSQISQPDYVFDNGANAALADFTPDYAASIFANGSFRWDSGAPIKGFDYIASPHSMDSGYSALDQQIVIDFFSKHRDPDASRFDATFVNSVWTVLDRDLIDFTGTHATHNSHPSPTQGIVSVTAYSLEGLHPTPSNWVSGPGERIVPQQNEIPEPASIALLVLGLVGLGFSRRNQ